MTTTVGTERRVEDLLEDLVQLDYDMADAYQAAIDRLDDARLRDRLREFKDDHLRHIAELGHILVEMGRAPPIQGGIKSLLTRGKIVIGGLIGAKAILQEMRTNEADSNIAYQRAVEFPGLDANTREVLERGLKDEHWHCEWILRELNILNRPLSPVASRGRVHRVAPIGEALGLAGSQGIAGECVTQNCAGYDSNKSVTKLQRDLLGNIATVGQTSDLAVDYFRRDRCVGSLISR